MTATMNSYQQFGIGPIWSSLSLINQLFLIFLIVILLYTLFLVLAVFNTLRQSTKNNGDQKVLSTSKVALLRKRVENLQQLQLFALYVFGFCIVVQIASAFETIENSNTITFSNSIRQLSFSFHYDATLFLVFLLIHSLQWLISARLKANSS
jgi:hypothetical protein